MAILGKGGGNSEKVTTITGTTLSGQTEGEAVFLSADGSFTTKEAADMKGTATARGGGGSSAWNSDSNHGQLIGYNYAPGYRGGPIYEYLTNGQFVGLFFGPSPTPSGSAANYMMLRTATKSGTTITHNHTVKSSVYGSIGGNNTIAHYGYHNAQIREIENDGTYTWFIVVGGYLTYVPAYRRAQAHIARSTNSSGALQWWHWGTTNGGQKNGWSPLGYNGGGGKFVTGTGSTNDYVQYLHHDFGNNTSAANHYITCRTAAFDKDSLQSDNATLTNAGTTITVVSPDNNNQDLGFISSSSADTTLAIINDDGTNNGPIGYKLVTASNGTTTATSLGAIPIGNFTTAANVQYMKHAQISTGVFCIIGLKQDNSNIIEMQKYTYDGNNTVAASGSLITITLPTTFTYPSMSNFLNYGGSESKFGAARWIYWYGDDQQGTTVKGTECFALEFNLNTGTLTRSYNIGLTGTNINSDQTNPLTGEITFTDGGLAYMGGRGNYENFTDQIHDLGSFLQTDKTEKAVGVALNTKTSLATDASVGLFAGKDSSDDLPSTAFVKKNNEFYTLKTGGSAFLDAAATLQHNQDPNKMPVTYFQYAPHRYTGSSVRYGYNSNWWTELGNEVAQLTSNSVGGTYRTIVNTSGRGGFLTCVIGPTSTNNNADETTTFKITVDGTLTTLAFSTAGYTNRYAYGRFILGALGDQIQQQSYTLAPNIGVFRIPSSGENRMNTDHSAQNFYNSTHYLPEMKDQLLSFPESCVRFETSLVVEVTHSVSSGGTGTSYGAHRCLAMYKLDAPSS